jgi:glutaryl-CoA dehydrogenase
MKATDSLLSGNRPSRFQGGRHPRQWSLRASVTSGLSLQDVRIPDQFVAERRIEAPLMCLNLGTLWGFRGRLARRCLATTARCNIHCCGNDSAISDRVASTHSGKLAWMISGITKAWLLVLQVGRLKDAGKVELLASRWPSETMFGWPSSARGCRDILEPTAWRTTTRHAALDEPGKREDLRGTHDIHTLIIGASVREWMRSDLSRHHPKRQADKVCAPPLA